jgi:predicted DNA binding CopG/RHH family protein
MKRKTPSRQPVLAFKSDREVRRFVKKVDLSKYDLFGFKPTRFEFERRTAQLNMRVSKPMLDAVKKRARARGIPYTRLTREAVE